MPQAYFQAVQNSFQAFLFPAPQRCEYTLRVLVRLLPFLYNGLPAANCFCLFIKILLGILFRSAKLIRYMLGIFFYSPHSFCTTIAALVTAPATPLTTTDKALSQQQTFICYNSSEIIGYCFYSFIIAREQLLLGLARAVFFCTTKKSSADCRGLKKFKKLQNVLTYWR